MSSVSSIPNKFTEGERILCYHGPLIYEAKCLKYRVSPKENMNEYWVHYAGWNKNWDEWVPENRILKYNESNVSRQKELQKSHKSGGQKRSKVPKVVGRPSFAKDTKPADARSDGSINDPDSRSSTPILDSNIRVKSEKKRESPSISENSIETPKRGKRGKQDIIGETAVQLRKNDFVIKFPDELKPWLVDDMICIQKKNKLAVLPANPNIEQVFEMYVKSKEGKGKTSVDRVCSEVVLGLQDYFSQMLRTKLLYKEERQQYVEFMGKNQLLTPCQIYGAHHLLRLFVKLGEAMAYNTLTEKSIALLLATIHDLLKYLATNSDTFFSSKNYT